MFQDFKQFVLRGNLLDLAVAFVVGAGFKEIVTSFVDNVLMPPIGMLLGGVDFTELEFVLKEATENTDAVSVEYGLFIQTVVDFLIVAAAIFVVVKVYEKSQKNEEVKPSGPTKSEVLLEEIRDLIKKK